MSTTILTITEAYEDAGEFSNLLDKLGFAQREKDKLSNEGFTSLSAIVLNFSSSSELHKELIQMNKTFATATPANGKAYFAMIPTRKFIAVHHYFLRSTTILGSIPDIRSITNGGALDLIQEYETFNSRKDHDPDVSLPIFKGDNWINFRDKFESLLSMTLGSRFIALSYVIRLDDNNATNSKPLTEVEAPDLTDSNNVKQNATLFGQKFKEDNEQVYNMLSSKLQGTVGWNYIHTLKTSKDGRSAYMKLKSHYEGESFKDVYREKAFATLSSTFYHGERSKFTYEKYLAIHMEAHRWLLEINHGTDGKGLDDTTKIQYFKTGIRPKAMLETALSVARSSPLYNTFDAFANFIAQEVNILQSRTDAHNKNVSFKVSDVHGRGGRGRGRYGRGGRGGRGNRGGRGRGGRGRGGRGEMVEGTLITGSWQPPHIFKNFTAKQKEVHARLKPDNKKDDTSISNSTIKSIESTICSALQNALEKGTNQASRDNELKDDDSDKANDNGAGSQFIKRRRKN